MMDSSSKTIFSTFNVIDVDERKAALHSLIDGYEIEATLVITTAAQVPRRAPDQVSFYIPTITVMAMPFISFQSYPGP